MKAYFRLLASLAICVSNCAATTLYVVTNNDNPAGNSISVFLLDTNTGVLTHHEDVPTGGFGAGGGYFATVGAAATVNGTTGCLFAFDTGSSDIASFKVNLPSLAIKKVGNFSNPALIAQFPGGSFAATPNGEFLYATYASTQNIGEWSVNSDCSLAFINAYPPPGDGNFYDSLKVTPSGAQLIAAGTNEGYASLFSINSTTGALTELQGISFWSPSECPHARIAFSPELTSQRTEKSPYSEAMDPAHPLCLPRRLSRCG